MGVIYRITSPSGKSYIGQTRRDAEKRKEEHFKCQGNCIILENAIKKYKDQMMFEVLFEVNDELLDFYETRFIEALGTLEPNGYNIRTGGAAGLHSAESCERMRLAKLGEKNHNFGKPRTDSAKLLISLSKSGENHHFYGKSLTEEHRLQLSASHKVSRPDLPMYMVYVKPRPAHYGGAGYAIVNHPQKPTKYFTSKKLSDNENYKLALAYLETV